jgi:DNA-binding SARP family transcriptional activator
VGREQLVETLWGEPGGADPAVGLKRLNVMVSTLRGVLDPDHTYPAGHYVVSEDGMLRLDLAHVDIDVARLLTLVDSASRLDRAGRHAEALRHWRAAEAAYTGGFCEEDPYADWAVALREQARLAYVEAARKVAEAESAAGRHAQAGRYWLRLLEHEPYDEHAHLGLVRALDSDARRMDARRHYHRYTELMAELGVEPSPYPTGVPDALTGRA